MPKDQALLLSRLFSTWPRRIGFAGALLLAMLVPANAADATAEPTCLVLSIEGKLDVAAKGQTAWKAAVTNQALRVGDRVRTGNRSRAALRWSDLSVVRVNELTTLELQPPGKAGNKPELDLKSGAAYFFSREKPSDVQFRTPVASGAIRGTEFNLAVAENGATELALVDGAVDLANAQGSVTLAGGELGSVAPGQSPRKTAMLDATSIIQWALYYPAVVDVDELKLGDAEQRELADSLKAYRAGDLLAALAAYPDGRTAASEAEKIYHAALLLAVGQAGAAERGVESAGSGNQAAFAVRELISVVKNQSAHKRSGIFTASEWLAASYSFQSKSDLAGALKAAKASTAQAPNFGFAWVRVAELEFSFGHTREALSALDKGLSLAPRHAQGLALKGFLLAAQGHTDAAAEQFEQAIAIDPALGNAWLGRGLVKFNRGDSRAGREDLQVAATLEPNRSMLRSYLGKAFAQTWDAQHAAKELALASKLDPNDPTPWLYSALLAEQKNQPNDAIADLEKSKQLNDNRSIFRSRLLLDQDQAVRGANLASIYRDAGMREVSVQEAARAVNSDYANFSAHLFLSSSFDSLRDPKSINLRYETPWFSELLLANLLAPVGGGNLSQNISQQEYARLFEGRHHGIFSATDYSSQGDWRQVASQYGNFGHTAYSFDTFYTALNGDRANNDLDSLGLAVRVKQEITAKDSLFLQLSYLDRTAGDLAQYYDQSSASGTVRVREKQLPNFLLGYHREWSPGNHTLFLASRFDDTLEIHDPAPAFLWLRTAVSPFTGATNVSLRNPSFLQQDYKSKLAAYSAELQQIWQTECQTLVAGVRLQIGWPDTRSAINRQTPFDPEPTALIAQNFEPELSRANVYAYDTFKLLDNLRLTAGLSYDRLSYPLNVDTAPISSGEADADKVSPKVGLVWSPCQWTHLRGSYTRSLGGVFFDNSIRLEPVQVAGFNQAFRSLVPESVAGLVPGTEFETWGVGLDQSFPTRTYLTVQAEWLDSVGVRTLGLMTNSDIFVPVADSASSTRQLLDFGEKSLLISANQLVGEDWALGARYKLTKSRLATVSELSPALNGIGILNQDVASTLHQVTLFANYNHRCGFFGEFNAVWSQQSNRRYAPDIPGDDFWQFNLYLGYRFKLRHAEARLGLINLNDRDYKLNPLTLYNELPRQRALTCSFKFYF